MDATRAGNLVVDDPESTPPLLSDSGNMYRVVSSLGQSSRVPPFSSAIRPLVFPRALAAPPASCGGCGVEFRFELESLARRQYWRLGFFTRDGGSIARPPKVLFVGAVVPFPRCCRHVRGTGGLSAPGCAFAVPPASPFPSATLGGKKGCTYQRRQATPTAKACLRLPVNWRQYGSQFLMGAGAAPHGHRRPYCRQ